MKRASLLKEGAVAAVRRTDQEIIYHVVNAYEHLFTALPLSEEVTLAFKNRPDLRSLAMQNSAQQTAVTSAKANFGPRVDTFGSWQTDRQTFAGAGGNNWTAGAEIRMDLLPFEKRARVQQEKAGLLRSQAGEESAKSMVRVQVSRAYYEHQAAEQTVEVARSARTQAAESLRILRNRYEAGLATLTDVLRAEDAGRESETGYWRAVYRSAISYASLRLATGSLNQDQVVNFQWRAFNRLLRSLLSCWRYPRVSTPVRNEPRIQPHLRSFEA